MNFLKKNVFLLSAGLISLLLIVSPQIPPEKWWISSILTHLAIPIFLLHLVLLPVFLYKKHWFLFIQIVVLGFGIPIISKMYVIPSGKKNISETENNNFRILSYNTSFFRAGHIFSDQYYAPELNLSALNIKDWLGQSTADIICLQEFFDDVNSEIFNNVASLEKKGEYEYKFLYKALHENGTRRGLITFSKFPIIDYGTIFLSDNRYNGAMYTDVKVFGDTLRVINVHLESYNILEKKSLTDMLQNFKRSSIRKNIQVSKVLENIQDSPYKVIICGDFNAPPYSFTYKEFGKVLKNSFEQAGAGFGATYSGTSVLPSLRIDHQFVHPSIGILSFIIHKGITYSDHIPIEVEYTLKRN